MAPLLKNVFLNKSFCLTSLLFSFFVFPLSASAATLFVAPQSKDIRVDDTFIVLVNTNTQGTAINAASVDIKFDQNLLSAQSVGYSNSIFTLWAEEPKYSNLAGNIHLSGGLSSPGFTGSNGAILRITFKARAVGQTQISLENGSVLANDGIGTDVLSSVQGSSITINKALPVVETKIITTVTTATSSIATTTIGAIEDLHLVPIITNVPEHLKQGSLLTFSGTGVANGQILVYVGKGKNNPAITQVNTVADGKFEINYEKPVLSGYYKIWARNLLPNGIISTSSDISYVEVTNDNFITINNNNISYIDIIMTLLILIFIIFVSWLVTLFFYFKLKKKRKTSSHSN